MQQFQNVRITKECYNFRCNICGDSKKIKKKKRGYILIAKLPWVFKCHNCGVSMLAERWLKEYYPMQYKQYVREILQGDKLSKDDEERKVKKLLDAIEKKNRLKKLEIKKNEKNVFSHFKRIEKGTTEIFDVAQKYCIERKIPDSVWRRWFVCTGGKYGGRLIIPFYNKEGRIYYFQGRTLCNQIPKYLNREDNKEDSVYNIYNIDKTKPVIAVEGVIDSLMVENSISILGLTINDTVQKTLKKLDTYYIMDSDDAGQKKTRQLIKKGETVFIWSKFLKDKLLTERDKWDMNDVYLKLKRNQPFTFNELEPYFSNSYYDSVWLR